MNRLLGLYARLMCRAIWAARRFFPPKEGPLPDIPWLKRDWEWHGWHDCENCGYVGKHLFIEWLPEHVTTAECLRCGLVATL